MRLPTKPESDYALYYVPNFVRSFADTTTLNLFRFMYKSAKATSTPEQLEEIRANILEVATKLEASAAGWRSVLADYESTFVKGLLFTGAASFALSVASCVAGYVVLPIISLAITWAAIAPFLTNPGKLAIKLRSEFDTGFNAALNNTVTRGTGVFQRMAAADPIAAFSNWLRPRANRG